MMITSYFKFWLNDKRGKPAMQMKSVTITLHMQGFVHSAALSLFPGYHDVLLSPPFDRLSHDENDDFFFSSARALAARSCCSSAWRKSDAYRHCIC